MNSDHPSVRKMWKNYLSSIGETPENTLRTYSAWHFCNTQSAADELAVLVLRGEKSGTATSLWSIEAEGESLPCAGELSIITKWNGEAQCIIETVVVEIVPFKEVTADFAATEGEGDKSLDYWRRVHKEVFTQELNEVGLKFSDEMPVLCETFKVVWPLLSN